MNAIQFKGISGIYCIKNKQNNKCYIGQSKNIYLHIKQHITALNTCNKKQENEKLIEDWKIYGKENFECLLLEEFSKEDYKYNTTDIESLYMDEYDSIENGYNLRKDGSSGMITYSSTSIKLSIASKKRFENPDERVKLTNGLAKYKEENLDWKEKMSKAVSKAKMIYNFEQYDKQMNLIKVWNSIEDIIKENPEYKWQNIYSVCNGYKPTIYGFIWKKKLKI